MTASSNSVASCIARLTLLSASPSLKLRASGGGIVNAESHPDYREIVLENFVLIERRELEETLRHLRELSEAR